MDRFNVTPRATLKRKALHKLITTGAIPRLQTVANNQISIYELVMAWTMYVDDLKERGETVTEEHQHNFDVLCRVAGEYANIPFEIARQSSQYVHKQHFRRRNE